MGDFLKKYFLTFLVLFCLIFSFNVSAQSNIEMTPSGEFYVFGKDNTEIAEILGIESNNIQNYYKENSIIYLAVNSDNTKQIKCQSYSTDFSNSIVNISSLSNDKIISIIPDIIGFENVKGAVVEKNGQKFVKLDLRSSDSGGDYILTQYITVAGKKIFVVGFYTKANISTDYVEKSFETLNSPLFLNNKNNSKGNWYYIILLLSVVFALVTVFIIYTIIRDIKYEKTDKPQE